MVIMYHVQAITSCSNTGKNQKLTPTRQINKGARDFEKSYCHQHPRKKMKRVLQISRPHTCKPETASSTYK
jgi:hypothetical protein